MEINKFGAWMTQAKLYVGYVEPTDRPPISFYLGIIEGLMDILSEKGLSFDMEGILKNHRISENNHKLAREMILPPNSYYVRDKTLRIHGIPFRIPVNSETIIHLKQNPFIRLTLTKTKYNKSLFNLDVPEQTIFQIEKDGSKIEMNWNSLRDLQNDSSKLMNFLKNCGFSITQIKH